VGRGSLLNNIAKKRGVFPLGQRGRYVSRQSRKKKKKGEAMATCFRVRGGGRDPILHIDRKTFFERRKRKMYVKGMKCRFKRKKNGKGKGIHAGR